MDIEAYRPVMVWILQREVKLKLRKNTRSGKGTDPNAMVYGVNEPSAAAAPPSQAAAAQGADPWHGSTSAADPWATSTGLPDPAAAAADHTWPDSSAPWTSALAS